MFLSKKQLKIIDVFRKDILLKDTIAKIASRIKSNYPRTHDAVAILAKNSILDLETVGNSKLCRINLSDNTISILSYLDEQEAFSKNIPNMDKLLAIEELSDDIIIVTGSYASGTQNKNSDIDAVVIVKNDAYARLKLLETETSLYTPNMHLTVFTYDDFKKMMLDKKENFGKEIIRKHTIFRNAEKYYRLIRDAKWNQ
jgi:predicted nucleotidyltransferase